MVVNENIDILLDRNYKKSITINKVADGDY